MPSDPIEQKYSSSHFMSLQAVLAYTALAIFVYLLHLGGYTSYISWPMSYYYPDQLTGEEWLWAALVGLFVAAACVLVPLVLKEADGYT
ncbi:MAG: hypothetical protein QF886_11390, partial [Planctomycetota bacterium]|nr:hypothetical protein [Planctomycetota bacterium]